MANIASIEASSSIQKSVKSLQQALQVLDGVVLGKSEQVRLAVCCMLAGGHLLIEDLPGMGKTTLSHALGKVLGLEYQRIQFTSDMLPADVLGSQIFRKEDGSFSFVKGPVFTQLLLADEINRSTPKTQSALLEAMEERQVSIDGQTYPLPEPFFVIATQNPSSQSGTYPLPESQLDRFLMRLSLGYPGPEAERRILQGENGRAKLDKLQAVISDADLRNLRELVSKVKASEAVLDYLQRLIDFSRTQSESGVGLSPRAGLGLLQAARACAFIDARSHIIPEDIQQVLMPVAAHRLDGGSGVNASGASLVAKMLDSVAVIA